MGILTLRVNLLCIEDINVEGHISHINHINNLNHINIFKELKHVYTNLYQTSALLKIPAWSAKKSLAK